MQILLVAVFSCLHLLGAESDDKMTLEVEVQIPSLTGKNVQRCICFELYDERCNHPLVKCTELRFGPPKNLKGHATGTVEIDKGDWTCIAAVDSFHTLRSQGELKCKGNTCKAAFKGDPKSGGNRLVSGNLDYFKGAANTPNTTDLIDFCQFILSIKRGGVASANTDCTKTTTSHGDINGDGLVDIADFRVLESNFAVSSKVFCCATGASPGLPVTEISIEQMRQLGLSDLAVADLNGDGTLDRDDMAVYRENPQAQEEALRAKARKPPYKDLGKRGLLRDDIHAHGSLACHSPSPTLR